MAQTAPANRNVGMAGMKQDARSTAMSQMRMVVSAKEKTFDDRMLCRMRDPNLSFVGVLLTFSLRSGVGLLFAAKFELKLRVLLLIFSIFI